MFRVTRQLSLATMVVSLILLPLPDVSAQVLEELVITARKVEESLQDAPISVSVMTGDRMMESGVTKVQELAAYVPNFVLSETGIGTNVYIRGIGSGINQGFEQSVGMYVDGLYYGRAQLSRAPFLDLAQVEVARGPQVTLLGNNSIAGALNLTTQRPSDEFEFSVNALYEFEHDEQEITGVISGPLFSNFSARVAARYRTMDGFLNNVIQAQDEPDREEASVRMTLLWEQDTWEAALKYEKNIFDVKGRQIEIFNETPSVTRGTSPTGFSNNSGSSGLWVAGQTYLQYQGQFFDPNPLIQDAQLDENRHSNGDSSDNDTDAVALTFTAEFGEHEFTSISGYLAYDYIENCDCDFTGSPVFSLISEEDYKQFSQEFRLTSAEDRRFRYMVGLYYQSEELEFGDQILLPVDGGVVDLVGYATSGDPTAVEGVLGNTSVFRNYEQKSYSSAVFGQIAFDITEDWNTSIGLRYTRTEKEAFRVLREGDLNRRPFLLSNPVEFNQLAAGAVIFSSVFDAAFHELTGSRDEDHTSFAIVSNYHITDDVMVFGSVKRGFKAGGFDVRSNSEPVPGSTGSGKLYPAGVAGVIANVPAGSFEFEEEEATAFELGAKTSLFDGSVELNIAAFLTKYEDLQVSIFDGTLGFNVGNAAKATTQGVELEGRWAITESWFMNASIGYLDFEFDNFPNGQCTNAQNAAFLMANPNDPVPEVCDYTGKTNQYVADWSGSVSLNFEQPIGPLLFRSTLDVLFTTSYLPSQNLDLTTKQDGYAKLNLRVAIGAEDGTWEIAFLGRNLTDETIVTYANDTPLAFSQFGSPSYYGFIDRTRSVGLQAAYNFP